MFQWTALIAMALGGVVGVASALWAEPPLPPVPSDTRKAPGPKVELGTRASAASEAGCNPPYTSDSAGRYQHKPHCL